MSCTQANAFIPSVKFGIACRQSRPSYVHASWLGVSANHTGGSRKLFPRLVSSQPNHRRFDPICLATGNSNNGNRGFPWEPSNRGGDGGQHGGHYGGDGDGSQQDQNLWETLDEVLQVVLATIGCVFVYTYLLSGAELIRLARDYNKYRHGGPTTPRMRRAVDKWRGSYESIIMAVAVLKFWLENWRESYKSIIRSAEVPKVWLGRIALAVPVLLQNPGKLAELMRPASC